MLEHLVKNCISGAGYVDMSYTRRAFEAGTGCILRESLDAIKPLYKARDRTYFIHHVKNGRLTAEFYNFLKGTNISLSLALLKEAMRVCEIGNEEKMRQTECAYDHFTRIRTVLPLLKDSRLKVAATKPDDWYPGYDAMMKRGLYNLSFDEKSLCTYKWRHHFPSPTHAGEADFRRLNQLFETFQADKTINPSGKPFSEANHTKAYQARRGYGIPNTCFTTTIGDI
jgi:hypothetical protein